MNIITKNKGVVKVMYLKENQKVQQSNKLILSCAKMEYLPLKLFEYIVSFINPKNPPQDNIIITSKPEAVLFLGIKGTDARTQLKKIIENFHSAAVFSFEEETKRGTKYSVLSAFVKTVWTDYDDHLIFKVNDDIMPFLIEFQGNYTEYFLSDIHNLKNKYSIIIFKWLIMNYNQYKRYNNSKLKNPIISMEELRKITDTSKEYPRIYDFTKKVIEKAVDEINFNTFYKITYQKIKNGTVVNAIQFFIEFDKEAFYYFSNQLRTEELETKKSSQNKEKHIKENLYDALQNNYIKYLLDNTEWIKENNFEIIVDAFDKLVPIYDKLESMKTNLPEVSFEKHIEYVKSKIQEIESPSSVYNNIVTYLQVAGNNYISKLINKNKIPELEEEIVSEEEWISELRKNQSIF